MPREQAVKARKQRNAALVEVMLLAAMADGRVSQVELQTLLRRVIERPEFEGTKPDELNALVIASAQRLSKAHDMDEILVSFRARLPDHKTRMLAFGLAASIAFADHRATRTELGLLKMFQAALGISEDEVAQIIDVIEGGGSLSEALGEPLERLYAEVMVLVSAADGQLKEAEARELVESFASDPLFHNVSPDRAQEFVSESVAALMAEGLPQRLQVLAHGLSTHAQRMKAYRLATKIAHAGGQEPSAGEQRILHILQATFGLADDEVERLDRQV
ncbi:TerB family tellurite resistance protein [[Archangium] primigenium]|uniref:TerB family tellurite resistance protein n=1 Tax=Melittangium TaxID=44 RepID=UPI00195752F9|nr:TerB family tellurite resistance protein [Archangium primigenium]MBM7113908.1 TerB family tellurite resistance protein [Archangium primigenium]